jgi:glycosyltransferase involved in cell wall biosynthesis
MDSRIARSADRLVTISEAMRETYVNTRKVDPGRVVVVRNWQDDRGYRVEQDPALACQEYGIPSNRFTFLYLGNIGPVASVPLMIKAFHAADLVDAQMVVVGEGSEKARCMALVRELSVPNVYFVSEPRVEKVPALQSMANVLLLPTAGSAALSSVPSKLIAYLFSGRPVLALAPVESDTALTVRNAGAGWIGPVNDFDWLVDKLRVIRQIHPEELQRMGQAGRAYGFEHLGRSKGIQRLAGVILASAP